MKIANRGSAAILIFCAGALGLLFSGGCRTPETVEWGHFESQPQTEWLNEGRKMRLLQEFVYVDRAGKRWVASRDSEVDGASIPPAFWTLIGGPLEGKYRNASVVHDTECDGNRRRGTNTWQSVHRMFYEACRCGGTPPKRAAVMYWAVYHFGPRWKIASDTSGKAEAGQEGVDATPTPIEEQVVALVRQGRAAARSVYAAKPLAERQMLLERIHAGQRRLQDARTKAAAAQAEADLKVLAAQLHPEEELVDIGRILKSVESRIEKQALSLDQIEGLRLENVLPGL